MTPHTDDVERPKPHFANVAAVIGACLAIICVTVAGLAIGTAPDLTKGERIAHLRVTASAAEEEILLSATDRQQIMELADGVSVTTVRPDLSSTILPEKVSPDVCVGDLSYPRAVGGLSIAETATEGATASLESSVLIFETPSDARAAFERVHELLSSRCAAVDAARADTSLTMTTTYLLEPIETSYEEYPYYEGTNMVTFSDGFIQRGSFTRYLIGNAVFYLADGVNQPLRDAPWGGSPRDVFDARLADYIAAQIADQTAE